MLRQAYIYKEKVLERFAKVEPRDVGYYQYPLRRGAPLDPKFLSYPRLSTACATISADRD